jgi:Tol biopolymer transport system component
MLRLAFETANGSGIDVVDLSGTHIRVLTRDPNDANPKWSPDGTRIAFDTSAYGDRYDVYVVNANGSERRRLTRNRVSNLPLWSPSGTQIYFMVPSDNFSGLTTKVMNADGSSQSPAPSWFPGSLGSAFSPNGQQLAFSSDSSRSFRIGVMPSDGSGSSRLTRPGSWPSWSPNSAQIAFAGADGNVDIMNQDGSGLMHVTHFRPGDVDALAWSPDGHWIAFDHHNGIYLIRTNGTGLRALVKSALNPTWKPC